MGFDPDRQQDLFKPPSRSEALPAGVQTRLRPLLLALLTEAACASVTAEAMGEIGDDQDHA
jgi:hypothetical protein